MPVIYEKVALIGLGLIASSMFWAMKRGGLAGHVSGFARSAETRDTAREIGLCDEVCDSIAKTVKDADLVVLCVPVGVMGSVAAEMAGVPMGHPCREEVLARAVARRRARHRGERRSAPSS